MEETIKYKQKIFVHDLCSTPYKHLKKNQYRDGGGVFSSCIVNLMSLSYHKDSTTILFTMTQ